MYCIHNDIPPTKSLDDLCIFRRGLVSDTMF